MANFLCLLVIFIAVVAVLGENILTVDNAIEKLCGDGDLYAAVDAFGAFPNDARALHSLSALQLILHANVNEAVSLHKLGKAADFSAIPPLAKRHIDGKECAGLGDLFYVSAVIIKELVDTDKALPNVLKALKTLITLTSDSGLHQAAENAITLALTLAPEDASFHFRAAVMTPGVYESMEHINATRALLSGRISRIADPFSGFTLTGLDEFTMSPTFYFVYQGLNDQALLTRLQEAYIQAHPLLGANHIAENVLKGLYFYQQQQQQQQQPVEHTTVGEDAATTPSAAPVKPASIGASSSKRKIRVGFVSSHFRRHSICKLFCGVMMGLDFSLFEVFAFSSLQENREDATTQALRESHITYVPIGMTFVKNRNEVTDRAIDILVSECMMFSRMSLV